MTPRTRRVLYNFDGDSCLTTRAGGKGPVATDAADMKRLIDEVAFRGSRVDTVLVCINAQVLYYPTKVGTLRGTASTPDERARWPESEKRRFANVEAFIARGEDPYALMLAAAKKRRKEALLTFRMNDDHGNDFLRTTFREAHPDCRLGSGALDFAKPAVRDYTVALIDEALSRYKCDGIELDFNRFPRFFPDSVPQRDRIAAMDEIVARVRQRVEARRRKTLAVRVPSNFGRTPPTPESARALGCDVAGWVKSGWVDFVTVSEFLFVRYDLPIRPWKVAIADVPVYGGIECTEGGTKEQYLTADKYRRAADHLIQDGADGIYLFNFFTTREYGPEAWEPPFDVLRTLGKPA